MRVIDMPSGAAAQWLIEQVGVELAHRYADERSSPRIETERGHEFWRAVRSDVEYLADIVEGRPVREIKAESGAAGGRVMQKKFRRRGHPVVEAEQRSDPQSR